MTDKPLAPADFFAGMSPEDARAASLDQMMTGNAFAAVLPSGEKIRIPPETVTIHCGMMPGTVRIRTYEDPAMTLLAYDSGIVPAWVPRPPTRRPSRGYRRHVRRAKAGRA